MKISQTVAMRTKAPESGYLLIWDGGLSGFGLRVTSSGAKSFILQYRVNGRERRYTIGQLGAWTAETARKEAIRLQQEVDKGVDPFDLLEQKEREAHEEKARRQEAEARKRTLKQLSDAYLKQYAEQYKRPRSVYEDRNLLESVILPRLGSMHLGDINRRDIAELHATLKATPYRANRAYALLHTMFAWAVSDDSGEWAITTNPAAGVQRYHEEKRDRWLSEDELQRLADALEKFPRTVASREVAAKQRTWLRAEAQRAMDAIRLILLTGCRKGEALTAKWEDFDLTRGTWRKPSHHTKQKKTEHIPLSQQALALLEGLEQKGEYLFPSRYKEGSARYTGHLADLKNVWAGVCKLAKLDSVRIHDLRHTFASYLVSGGESLPIVGGLLGHTQPQTTARYAHLADNPLRAAANKFPAFSTAAAGRRGAA